MKKMLILSCLFIANNIFASDGFESIENDDFSINLEMQNVSLKVCCPRTCPRGPTGATGPAGPAGPTGATGPGFDGQQFEINDIIVATSNLPETLIANSLISFTSPIVTPVNGIDVPAVGGLSLVESVSASGIFDTITLPVESTDTFYLVTYSVRLAGDTVGRFSLVLNGVTLPYTSFGGTTFFSNTYQFSRTSLIMNPANVAGTLSVISLEDLTVLSSVEVIGISASIAVVKLNSNGP